MNDHTIRSLRSGWIAALMATLAVAAALVPAAASADEAMLCSPSSVDSDHMCHFDASGPYSDITMVFPADYPDEQTLIAYLTKVENDYIAARGPLTTLTSPNALQVTGTRYSSGPQQTGTQSVVTEIFQNLGSAHPLSWYKSFNYNLATHTPITFDSLFKPGTQPLQVILPAVKKTLTDRYGPAVSISDDTGLKPANYQSFAMTNDAVIFFFDKNALQPAMEATEVSVPRSTIASMLSPDIA
jgi:hypothetical protein